MAELLVKAKAHWMDSLPQSEIDKMDEDKLRSFNGRSQIGDVIVVRPDSWEWGKEECLPNFVVVKIPNLSYEEAKKYEKSLMEEIDVIDELSGEKELEVKKKRKYQIPKTIIDNAKAQSQDAISINAIQKDSFIANITDKSK